VNVGDDVARTGRFPADQAEEEQERGMAVQTTASTVSNALSPTLYSLESPWISDAAQTQKRRRD